MLQITDGRSKAGFVADADLRRAPAGRYQPSTVGAMAGRFEGTATPLVRSRDGWNYGGEIDIVPNVCYELAV